MLLVLIAMGACGGDVAPDPFPPVGALPERAALPDPLVTESGGAVTTIEAWETTRVPELRALFSHYVYGFAPEPVEVSAREVAMATAVEGGTYREIELTVAGAPIHLALFLPDTAAPPPVFLTLNKCGNQSLTTDERIRATTSWQHADCDPGVRGTHVDSYPIATILSRGYALATFHESDVDPDDANDASRALGVRSSLDVDAPDDVKWGTIAAWAYGLSRAMDYLATAPEIDGARVAVTGHSRRGKAALLAAAFDSRFALVIPHQSGTAGVALSRVLEGESVAAINLFFPHWFNDVFPTFASFESRLPIDQHLLIALVAPRPFLATDGSEDAWADPRGAREAVEAADPVWELYGGEGAIAETDGTLRFDADLAWRERPGDHSLRADDWTLFLDFADAHLR